MSPHVIGYDLSLSSTGVAQLHQDGRIYTWRHQTDPLPADAPIAAVCARLRSITSWAVERATVATVLAVIEELPRGTQHGQHDERAALVWAVAGQLVRHHVPVALVNPTTLKHRIAGNGRASKDQVRRAVAALYPGRGLHQVSYDEADAAALATLGTIKLAQVHGPDGPWSGPWLSARALAIDTGARWPDLTPEPTR